MASDKSFFGCTGRTLGRSLGLTSLVMLLMNTVFTVTPAGAVTPPYAYVANINSNNVSVINTTTNVVVKTVTVGTNPEGVAITPNGSYAYVTNSGSNTVSVISTSTNAIVKTVTVKGRPYAIAITPNGSYAYVADDHFNNVSVISTSTNTVVKIVGVGTTPEHVAITPNGSYAYVTNVVPGTVSVINTSTNTVVKTVAVGGQPYGIAIAPGGSYAYVTGGSTNNVSVINTSTNAVVSTVSVKAGPEGVAVEGFVPPTISGLRFTGSPTSPTVTVNGTGFGAQAWLGTPQTPCGGFDTTGKDYGNNLIFSDSTQHWGAGQSCDALGLQIQSYSPTQIVFRFGNAYPGFGSLIAGDSYSMTVLGRTFSGTVAYT